jgi:ferrous iron transport protein B
MMLQALDVGYKDVMTVITKEQLVVCTVFINFFIPCLSTVALLWKEIGKRIALISIGLNTGVAIILSLIARLILRR